jgi:hypothetical protein
VSVLVCVLGTSKEMREQVRVNRVRRTGERFWKGSRPPIHNTCALTKALPYLTRLEFRAPEISTEQGRVSLIMWTSTDSCRARKNGLFSRCRGLG